MSLIDIFELAQELRAKGESFVLATVVAYKHPQSAKPGSKAIIRADGSITGWIGGGCVQPIVAREAKKILEQKKSRLVIISPDQHAHEKPWQGVHEFPMS